MLYSVRWNSNFTDVLIAKFHSLTLSMMSAFVVFILVIFSLINYISLYNSKKIFSFNFFFASEV